MRKSVWAGAILIFLVLSLSIFWVYLPSLVQQKLTASLKEFNSKLHCFGWQIVSLERLHIENLCLEYRGMTLVVQDAQVDLSLSAFWQQEDYLKLVRRVVVRHINITLPVEQLAGQDGGKTRTDTAPVLPFLSMPDFSIKQLNVRFEGLNSQQAIHLTDHPLLSWQLQWQSQPANNRLKATSTVDKQLWLQANQNKNGQLSLNWQLKLKSLHQALSAVAPQPLTESLTMLTDLSGRWQGRLTTNVAQLSHWQSSHDLHALKAQLRLPAEPSYPLSLQGNLAFKLRNSDTGLLLQPDSSEAITLTGLKPLVSQQLTQLQGQQWQLHNPLADEISIELHSSLSLSYQGGLKTEGALQLKSAQQKLVLEQVKADLKNISVSADFRLDGNYQLTNEQQNLPFNGQMNGDFSYTAEVLTLNVQKWQAQSDNIIKLIPDNLPLELASLRVSGQSAMSFAQQSWQLDGHLNASAEQPKLELSPALSAAPDKLTVTGTYSISPDKLSSENRIFLSEQVLLFAEASGSPAEIGVTLDLPAVAVQQLRPLIQGLPTLLQVQEGTLTGSVKTRFSNGELEPVTFQVDINEFGATFDNYLLAGLDTSFKGWIDKQGNIHSPNNTLKADSFFAGVTLGQIALDYAIAAQTIETDEVSKNTVAGLNLEISNFSADVLGGNVGFKAAFYPLAQQEKLNVQVTELSVTELVGLFNQQGLEVTGALSGIVPLSFSEGSVSVQHANLSATGPGKIRISDNPAFINLKNSQKNLALALGLLENLEYSQLQTSMSMQENGWLELAVKIRGVNPEKQQPINFNPTFSTNLYTGLKALRAGKDISKAIEQRFDE